MVLFLINSKYEEKHDQSLPRSEVPYANGAKYRCAVSFLIPRWLRGENALQVKHFDMHLPFIFSKAGVAKANPATPVTTPLKM